MQFYLKTTLQDYVKGYLQIGFISYISAITKNIKNKITTISTYTTRMRSFLLLGELTTFLLLL